MANRVAEVNAELSHRGVPERLTRGREYYYFRGGDTTRWPDVSVFVSYADELSVEEWLHEYEELKAAAERYRYHQEQSVQSFQQFVNEDEPIRRKQQNENQPNRIPPDGHAVSPVMLDDTTGIESEDD